MESAVKQTEVIPPSELQFACDELIIASQELIQRADVESNAVAIRRTTQSLYWITQYAGAAVRGDSNWESFRAGSGATIIALVQNIVGFVLRFPGYSDKPELFSILIAAILTLGMLGHTPLGLLVLQDRPAPERENLFELICACTKDDCPVR